MSWRRCCHFRLPGVRGSCRGADGGGPAIDVGPGFADSASEWHVASQRPATCGQWPGLSRLVLPEGRSRAGKPELHLVLRVWTDAELRTGFLAEH